MFGRETGAREQFRLARLQTFNWGTFSGLADLPIARRGFLVLGPSGSGKSSLLDAYTALLTPPKWLDFNVAAREAERTGRDRTMLSYVRGAWAQQTGAAGEYAVQYLRPETTWSAIAATFTTEAGSAVTLAALFWITGRGTSTNDVRRRYLVVPREFSLRELEFFPACEFDVRRLQRELPDVVPAEQFSAYRERFTRLLGIESELALKLLHRTQSAKNLGDLNVFLRDFMLDVPETFERAAALVTEFGELKAAHAAVVAARRQIEILTPARDEIREIAVADRSATELQELVAGLEPYREQQRAVLLRSRIVRTASELDAACIALEQADRALADARLAAQELESRRAAAGGARIEDWRLQIQRDGDERARRAHRRERLVAATSTLGVGTPTSAAALVEAHAAARARLADAAAAREQREARVDELKARRRDAEAAFARARTELQALERQPSNIPSHLLALRDEMARSLAVSPQRLPFAGELMQVRDDARMWRGAINRALRGLALAVLVDESLYAAFSQRANEHHLGVRLVYFRIDSAGMGRRRGVDARDAARGAPVDALVRKLEFADRPESDWLREEVATRHALRCVDSLAAFRQAEHALTVEGLVKQGGRRHEKDDRRSISDVAGWVLGFDNHEKRAWYEDEVRRLGAELADLGRQVNEMRQQDESESEVLSACQVLVNLTWDDVDVASVAERIADLERRVQQELAGNLDLRRLDADLAATRTRCLAVQTDRDARAGAQLELERLLADLRTRLEQCETATVAPTPFQQRGLATRFEARTANATLETLDRVAADALRALGAERTELATRRERLRGSVEDRLRTFLREWPAEGGGIDAKLDSAEDFLAKLQRLEMDGLPNHEERFRRLLHEQGDQNLVLLVDQLERERRAIADRLEIVNDSLRRVRFGIDTHLVIDVSERTLDDVREFRRTARAALESAPGSSADEAAEKRFAALDALVARLGSSEPADVRWRELVLDVRHHVEFVGRELDAAGAEVEIYRSGAGKSGGQRQKLAATCLAAALRYQLGGTDASVPRFGTVVLDEAFDKADDQFTTLAMRIFESFGFQMIVATPLKAVMTLEPFVGGACFITIEERRRSGALLIEFDADTGRLRVPGDRT